MPTVGNKKFPYTAEGKAAAQEYSKSSGKQMKEDPTYGNKSGQYKAPNVFGETSRPAQSAKFTNTPISVDNAQHNMSRSTMRMPKGPKGMSQPGGRRMGTQSRASRPNPANLYKRSAVNSFMNKDALKSLNTRSIFSDNANDVKGVQTGINYLNRNRPGFVPLKVDGVRGPITNNYARRFLK